MKITSLEHLIYVDMYICKYVGTLIHIYVDMYIYIQSISTGFSGYKSLRPIYLHKF